MPAHRITGANVWLSELIRANAFNGAAKPCTASMYVDGLVVGASPRISARGGLISYGVDFLDQYSHAAVPAYIPDISGKDCKCARQWFDWQKPAWAPELPLRMKDRELLENDAEHQRRLVGLFGSSLRAQEWDYRTHPPFAAYCRG